MHFSVLSREFVQVAWKSHARDKLHWLLRVGANSQMDERRVAFRHFPLSRSGVERHAAKIRRTAG